MEKEILTVKEFMEYENIGRSKAYELVSDPEFYPAFYIGRKVLIDLNKLKQWNSEQGKRSMKKV